MTGAPSSDSRPLRSGSGSSPGSVLIETVVGASLSWLFSVGFSAGSETVTLGLINMGSFINLYPPGSNNVEACPVGSRPAPVLLSAEGGHILKEIMPALPSKLFCRLPKVKPALPCTAWVLGTMNGRGLDEAAGNTNNTAKSSHKWTLLYSAEYYRTWQYLEE